MSRQNRNRIPLLFLALILVAVSLACATAESLVNGTPTPLPPTSTATPLPPTGTPTITVVPTLDWTPIACTGDDCIKACMGRVSAILQTSPFKTLDSAYYNESTNVELADYPVDGNQLGELEKIYAPSDYRIYQNDTNAHQRIWDFFTAVIPLDMRGRLDKLVIFTDGPENVLAWVKPTGDNNDTWTIGFDILDSEYPPYLTETLVHEVGHLVTLNKDQVQAVDARFEGVQDPSVCKQYLLYEGCSNKDSYINLFYQRFWPDIEKEWQLINTASNTDEFYTMVQNFYRRHSREFVSSYAVTRPEEDIAESWKTFVLKPKPTGDSIAAQKVLFFYDFPELVKYRQQIIDGLCSYVR